MFAIPSLKIKFENYIHCLFIALSIIYTYISITNNIYIVPDKLNVDNLLIELMYYVYTLVSKAYPLVEAEGGSSTTLSTPLKSITPSIKPLCSA